MPQIKSAKKRVKTTARQTEENRLHKARSRTALKKVRTLVGEGKTTEALAEVAVAQKNLDKAAKVRAFHPNTAARYKSRLAALLKKSGVKGAVPAAAGGTKPSKPKVSKASTGKKPSAAPKKPAKAATTKKPTAKKTAK